MSDKERGLFGEVFSCQDGSNRPFNVHYQGELYEIPDLDAGDYSLELREVNSGAVVRNLGVLPREALVAELHKVGYAEGEGVRPHVQKARTPDCIGQTSFFD